MPGMSNTLNLGLTCLLAISVVGCWERQADVSSPQSYSKQGLSFQYPGNWKVTDDENFDFFRYLFIESPGDAIVIIQIFGREDALGLKEFSADFADGAKEDYTLGSISESSFQMADDYLEEQFSITILNETVPHLRRYMRLEFGQKLCFVIFQVADEDLEKAAPGFQLIVSSLNYTGE